MLIGQLKYVQHPTASTCCLRGTTVVGNNSFSKCMYMQDVLYKHMYENAPALEATIPPPPPPPPPLYLPPTPRLLIKKTHTQKKQTKKNIKKKCFINKHNEKKPRRRSPHPPPPPPPSSCLAMATGLIVSTEHAT